MAIVQIAPFVSCHCDASEFEEALAQGFKEIYIRTSKGILKHHVLRGENRYVRVKVDKIPGYTETELDQAMNFLPAGKVPYILFEQIEVFFKKVIKAGGTALEAMIFILWNKDEGYHLYVPEQSVAAASVRFDPTSLPGGSTVVVNVHSHGTMSAFFSGTDDNNDADLIQFSGVFGNFQNPTPSTVWRFNYYKTKFKCDVQDIFELPVKEEVAIPDEWLDKVKVSTPTTYGRGGYSGPGNVVSQTSHQRNLEARGRADHLKQYQFQKKDSPNTGNVKPIGTSNTASEANTSLAVRDLNFNGYEPDPEDFHLGFVTPPGANRKPTFTAPNVPGAAWKWDEVVGGYRNVAGTEEENDEGVIKAGKAVQDQINDEADESFRRAAFEHGYQQLFEDPSYYGQGEEAGSAEVGKPVVVAKWQDSPSKSEQSEAADDKELEDLNYQYEAIAKRFGANVADAWWSIDQEMSELHEHPLLLQGLIADMFNLLEPEHKMTCFSDMFQMLDDISQCKVQTEGFH